VELAAKNHRFGEKTTAFAKKLATFLKNAKFAISRSENGAKACIV